MNKYTYRVSWSEEDAEFVGTCVEFPSLSWLDERPETALGGIMRMVDEVVRDMQVAGETPPEPLATKQFSGRFSARVGPELHRRLTIRAAEAGFSLQRYVREKLGEVS